MGDSEAQRLPILALLAVLLAGAFAAHRRQLDVGLVGHDTLPLILTARVRDPGDLAENFTRKFMEDRFELDYYRPVLNLSAALDEALYGIEPRGWQRHSIALLGLAGAALFGLARRGLGGRLLGPFVGAAWFVLHSSHVDVLPIVARRHETLAALFACLALRAQLSERGLALRRPPVLPALYALCAMGSKETALALPALLAAAVALFSPRAGLGARLGHALTATLGSWLALGAALAARLAILGGMGGPPGRELALHPDAVVETLGALLLSEDPMRGPLGVALAAAVLLALGAAAAVGRARLGPRVVRTAVLGLLFALGAAAIHSLGGTHQPWYELLPLVGLALALAAAVEGLAGLARAAGTRAAAAAALGLLAALGAWQLAYSPLVHRYPAWEKADRLLVRFQDRVRPLVEAAPPGAVVKGPSIPARLVDDRPGARVTDASILTHRSVQAWMELEWPERRLRAAKPDEVPRPRRDEVVIVFRRLKNVLASDVGDRPGS